MRSSGKWFAAHVVMVVHQRGANRSGSLPVYENVFFLRAATAKKALELARKIGRSEEILDGMTWGGVPAQQRFAGVRKIVECLPHNPARATFHKTEATYTEMRIERRDIARYVNGKRCRVWIE